jgi:hypothetical protein
MRQGFWAIAALLLLGGCVTGSNDPDYSLGGGEKGVFSSANAGRPIPLVQIRGLDERQLLALFGRPQMDRRDAATRVLRYQSDACTLFVFVQDNKAQYADAYDTRMRPLTPADQCAGSVAAQKRTSA